MKLIGTAREVSEALAAFNAERRIPHTASTSYLQPFIEKSGWIGNYHGIPIEIEILEDYRTCSDDRLGLAWARLNTWKWDHLFGEEPKGFYDLNQADKHKIISPLMRKIEAEFAHRATSKAWWIHELGKTEEEWQRWYFDNNKEVLE